MERTNRSIDRSSLCSFSVYASISARPIFNYTLKPLIVKRDLNCIIILLFRYARWFTADARLVWNHWILGTPTFQFQISRLPNIIYMFAFTRVIHHSSYTSLCHIRSEKFFCYRHRVLQVFTCHLLRYFHNNIAFAHQNL